MSSLLRKLLVQGENGPEEAVIDGRLIQASTGESFETHASKDTAHVPAAADAGKLLASRAGAAPEWIEKAALLTDAALTGTPTAPTAPTGTDTDQIASTAFVAASVTAAEQRLGKEMANGIRLKGNLGSGENDLAALPSGDYQKGDAYYVAAAGTYAGQECEVGDTIVCRAVSTPAADADWFVIQKNLINAIVGPRASVEGNLLAFAGTDGDAAKDSGVAMADAADAVSKKHAHANAETLARFGTDADGALTCDGHPIGTCRIAASVEEPSAANAPAGTLFFVIENVA